jgi:hypothetical protein
MRVSNNKILQKYTNPSSHNSLTLLSEQNLFASNFSGAAYYRHTNASQAFRALQRFINTRFRRYLTYRRKGRGFGWKQYPNRRLYAMGITHIGSGRIRYPSAPAHAL